MPGVLAGIVGAIVAGVASESQYGLSLYQQFPARAPVQNSSQTHDNSQLSLMIPGDGRSAGDQAGYQLLALGVTLVIAVAGGLITGMYLHSAIFRHIKHWSLITMKELKKQGISICTWLNFEPQ
jgi:ammonium transporter Rh